MSRPRIEIKSLLEIFIETMKLLKMSNRTNRVKNEIKYDVSVK